MAQNIILTKQQRVALKCVFDRGPIYLTERDARHDIRQSYRQFRRAVVPGFDCIMVPWCGMWLGVERDGHTHS